MRSVARFDDQESGVRFILLGGTGGVEHHLVDGPLGDDDVILGHERQRAEHRVHGARAVVNEDALITHAVLVVVVHGLGRHTHAHLAICVTEEDFPPRNGIPIRGHGHALEVTHPHDIAFDILDLGRVEGFPARDLGGGVDVVEGGSGADETLGAEDLFGIESPIRAAELDVPGGGELAEFEVIGHDLPRWYRTRFPDFRESVGGVTL